MAALISAGHSDDVLRAFKFAATIGSPILKPAVSRATAAKTPAAYAQTPSIAWPAGGIAAGNVGYFEREALASDGVQTLVLGSSYSPGEPTVLRTPNGLGAQTANAGSAYMKVVLANKDLTRLLGQGGSSGSSAFATAQEFLAATALLAEHYPGEPIVVAPPQRWTPAPDLAAGLLTMTRSASWLSAVSLTALTSPKNLQTVVRLPGGSTHEKLSKRESRVLRSVNRKISQLEKLKYRTNLKDYLPVAVAESSAWRGASEAVALGGLDALAQRVTRQLRQGVQIEAEQRVTLGGLKGTVPVSIDNTLGFAVVVRLKPQYDQSATGIKITVSPGGAVSQSGLVTIPAHSAETVRLRVQATVVGSTAVTLSLQNGHYQPLFGSPAQRMTIQATQVGVLGVIIFAVALGVFLIATAARAARRGRAAPAADHAANPGPATEQAGDRPAAPAEPDTVMAERTELEQPARPDVIEETDDHRTA